MQRDPNDRSNARPFLKWAGGKRSSLPALLDVSPAQFGRYFEPFLGGAAVFFAIARTHEGSPGRYHLSDINGELIDTYVAVRDSVNEVVTLLKEHRYSEEHYYRTRDMNPNELDLPERAARMIYLNRTGFNGLYRVNRAGRFNVPMGRYENPVICDEVNLRACSEALRAAVLECASFETVLDSVAESDLVYLDPPYIPISETANFVSYSKGGFGMDKQESLACIFEDLNARNAYVILSNSSTAWVHERFRHCRVLEIEVDRKINSKAAARGPVGEVMVLSDRLAKIMSGQLEKLSVGRARD